MAVASFCAVILLCVQGIVISTFSTGLSIHNAQASTHTPSADDSLSLPLTGRRASGLLMETMVKMLASVPGAEERIVKSNAEQLCVAEVGLQNGLGQSSNMARKKATATTSSTFHSYPRLKQSETLHSIQISDLALMYFPLCVD